MVLGLAGLAVFLVSFDGSILVLALPAIARDFQASVPDLANLGSGLQVGALLGLPMAMLADRLGRRRLLAAAVLGFSLANLASAAAPSLAWLAGARVLAVGFESVAAAVATALVVEEVPNDQRGRAVAAITIAGGAGLGLTTLLYPLFAPHWRWLYLFGGVGIPAAAALARFLPESRAWSATRTELLPFRVLLSRPWRRRLVVAAVAAALSAVFFEPANILLALFANRELHFSPTLISAGVVISGLIALPAFPLGGWLSDRRGRRLVGASLSALTAVAAAAAFAGGTAAYWVGIVVWSFLASASVPVIGAWYGELFPTRARATSESVSTVAAAAGGVLGLQLVAAAQSHLGLGHSLAATGVAALVSAALLLALPETRGQPLPD
ncbi:MAG: MFS transporter [Candidatus Dormibacteraeota bacterium]|nr:MFS transporter [Candidatus Dormibacteraeota bacterium]